MIFSGDKSSMYKFERIQSANGLSEGVVHYILRDSRGFMWFGTQEGLNRYDGYKMKIYKKGTMLRSAPSNNQIISIIEDNNGFFWVGTAGGLNRFDPVKEKFIHYHNNSDGTNSGDNAIDALMNLNDSTLLVGTFYRLFTFNKNSGLFSLIPNEGDYLCAAINDFLRLKDGTILIASGQGLFVFDAEKNIVKIKSGKFDFQKLVHKNIWSVIQYSDDELWAANANGFFIINTSKQTIKFSRIDSNHAEKNFQVRSILKDSDGNVWFGTNAGLFKYYSASQKFILFKHDPSRDKSLSSDRINNLLEDETGLLWISTFGGGVNKLNLKQKKFFHYGTGSSVANTQLQFNFIMHIYGDAQNNLFISSLDKGFAVHNRRKSRVFHYRPFMKKLNEVAGNIFYFAFPYDTGKYFVFDYENLYSYSLSSEMIAIKNYSYPLGINFSAMIRDKDGVFWGTDSRGVLRFKETSSKKGITDLHYFNLGSHGNHLADDDSLIWVGASGLFRISKKTGRIKPYILSDSFRDDQMTNIIYFVHNSNDDFLWLGTYGNGLFRFDKKKEEFLRFNIDDGLPDNTVYAILQDEAANLWLSTNKGISNFIPALNKFINYDQSDGLLNFEFNRKACYKDPEGVMYFGGIEGIDYFNPEQISLNSFLPNIVLTDFRLFNESYSSAKDCSYLTEINLSYDENFFSFEFAALDFTDPASNQYAYMLEGVDQRWVKAGSNRTAHYTRISPGVFTFKVKGSNHDGVWNEAGLAIKISVSPPFWQTWWFRTSAGLALILVLTFFIRTFTNRLKKDKEIQEAFSRNLMQSIEDERKRIARELHDGLGQNLLIIKNKAYLSAQRQNEISAVNEEASIESLAMSSLNELREISYNLHPHHLDRLGLTNAFESIVHKVNNAADVKFNFYSDNIDDLIPKEFEIHIFRVVQEAVNNILKHAEAKNASIVISRSEKEIIINIEDDGKGFEAAVVSNLPSFGLSGMRERVKLLGGNFEIFSNPGLGTSIIIKIKSGK